MYLQMMLIVMFGLANVLVIMDDNKTVSGESLIYNQWGNRIIDSLISVYFMMIGQYDV